MKKANLWLYVVIVFLVIVVVYIFVFSPVSYNMTEVNKTIVNSFNRGSDKTTIRFLSENDLTIKEKALLTVLGGGKIFEIVKGNENFNKITLLAQEYVSGKASGNPNTLILSPLGSKSKNLYAGFALSNVLLGENVTKEKEYLFKMFIFDEGATGSSDSLFKFKEYSNIFSFSLINGIAPLETNIKIPIYVYVFGDGSNSSSFYTTDSGNNVSDLIKNGKHFLLISLLLNNWTPQHV